MIQTEIFISMGNKHLGIKTLVFTFQSKIFQTLFHLCTRVYTISDKRWKEIFSFRSFYLSLETKSQWNITQSFVYSEHLLFTSNF